MPARYLKDAPEIVRKNVLDVLGPFGDLHQGFDVILRPDPGAQEVIGLQIALHGWLASHFFLKPHEMRAYRARNRRKRGAWADLPERTQRALVAYLEAP
jgi:hypothetical protein